MDSHSRRDFISVFGATLASLLLVRCSKFIPVATCYAPLPPRTMVPATPREGLRLYWLRFNELASVTLEGQNAEDDIGRQMIQEHRLVLDELVARGEISESVASLVQESYAAAVYHVWRSNVPITCYEPMMVDYAPLSAQTLVQQSQLLSDIAGQGPVSPETLSKAQAALEHDMAFYDLSDAEIQTVYKQLIDQGGAIPLFQDLPLEVTPEARAAAQFIVELLTER